MAIKKNPKKDIATPTSEQTPLNTTTAATGFNALTQEAKRKGYLTHEDLLNLLPSDFVDPNQMESIIDRLNEMGIRVYEVPPDNDELLLYNSDDDEEELTEAIELIARETRTTDPVRMYMREMGSVELLTREGEIEIAKRIESGIRQVMGALVYYPEIIESFIKRYHKIVGLQGRLSDIISGYFESDEEVAARVALAAANAANAAAIKELEMAALADEEEALAALAAKSKSKTASKTAKKEDEEEGDGEKEEDEEEEKDEEIEAGSTDDEEDAFGDNGPDPIYTAEQMATLEDLFNKYAAAIKKYGKQHKTTAKVRDALAEHYSKFKLSIKQFLRQTMRLRNLLRETREQERIIIRHCVTDAKTPRKDFIHAFSGHESDEKWLDTFIKAHPKSAAQLERFRKDIQRAQ